MKNFQSRTMIGFILFFLIISSIACTDPDAWEEEQNIHQPAKQVMDAIGLKPGMVIGEVGAGRGRYTVKLASRVGEAGKVYANDISEKDLQYLRHRCKRDGIKNIETILGTEIDPKFPPHSLDMAFMINTYHHLNEPVELMKNLKEALKSNGILIVVDHDPEKLPGESWADHTTPKEKLLKEADEAGYELHSIETFLTRDNIFILRRKN